MKVQAIVHRQRSPENRKQVDQDVRDFRATCTKKQRKTAEKNDDSDASCGTELKTIDPRRLVQVLHAGISLLAVMYYEFCYVPMKNHGKNYIYLQ